MNKIPPSTQIVIAKVFRANARENVHKMNSCKVAFAITLGDGGERDVANRTIVIHAKPDDWGQPTGNAGARLACGVIKPQAEQASFIFLS